MNYIDQQLAISFIKAGLTPRRLEQTEKRNVNRMAEMAGFTGDQLRTIFERWDIEGAKKKARDLKKEAV
jgi:hypothetical protein